MVHGSLFISSFKISLFHTLVSYSKRYAAVEKQFIANYESLTPKKREEHFYVFLFISSCKISLFHTLVSYSKRYAAVEKRFIANYESLTPKKREEHFYVFLFISPCEISLFVCFFGLEQK